MKKIWNVAIYARVSTERKDQQESIPAQVQSLRNWLKDKNKSDLLSVYNVVEVYEDAGFSGSNFERDSFIRMKEDIEAKRINMVITRDLSRFGRDYLGTGEYLEKYFKINGTRYISVQDNVDTLDEINEIIPIKNIFNEMYIRDCSKKSRDGLKQRMLRGSSIASKPPFGYNFDVQIKSNVKTIKLVIALDETSKVVRLIFDLYRNGWGYGKIATYLNSKNIEPPASRIQNFSRKKYGIWSSSTISYILKNPKYGGMMVQQRWRKLSYKLKKIEATKEEDWIYGEEFEGIIKKEIFEEVQKLMKTRTKNYRYKGNNIYPFSTVLKCNECDSSISYRKAYKGYKCTNSQRGGGRCTSHSIKEDYLKSTISSKLKAYVEKFVDKESLYDYAVGSTNEVDPNKTELKNIEVLLNKLDNQFQKVYQDKIDEVINERNFHMLVQGIERNQEKLLAKKAQIEDFAARASTREDLSKGYKENIDRILNFDEFDRITVESLIEKIIVTEDKKNNEKRLDIFYKFKI
ncbi:MAG: recombinase family protein [Clostridiaceae bacterium]|nr:recombinase family protein [Clostridiaceae bacterium]